MGTLVAKLLLPTLSSLALLPTISIAAKRRFHMEAMVYLFTMFFEAVSLGRRGGSWEVGWGTDPKAQGTLPQAEEKASLPTAFLYFVRSKSDLRVKERAQKPGNRVREPSGPQFLHRCQKLLWGRCE